MRAFLVKYLALYYHFKLFGKRITILRAVTILVPTFIICFLLLNNYNTYVDVMIFVLIGVIIWLTFRLQGIGYFALYPIAWHELDTIQKYYYGYIKDDLSECQKKEWKKIVISIDGE